MTTATATSWRDRPIDDLKIPKATKKFLKERATMPSGDGLTCWGDVWDALEEAHDIGLDDLQERVRGQIEDAKRAEEPLTLTEAIDNMAEPVLVPEAAAEPEALPETVGDLAQQIVDAAVPRVACGTCHGSGLIEENQCPACKGEGTVIDQSAAVQSEPEPEFSDHDMLEQIRAANAEVKEAEAEMDEAAEVHKAAKKKFDYKVECLRKIIDRSQEPTEPNLFSGTRPSKNGSDYSKSYNSGEKPEENVRVDPRLENLWREYPLERYTRFDLPESVIRKLAEHSPPILTVGELADFTVPKAGGYTPKITDVKGIGKAKVQLIEDAGIAFWAWWNAGGQAEFAKERGLDNEPVTGTDGEGAGPIDPGEALADTWSEPGPAERAEA